MFRYDRRQRNNIDVKELVDKIWNEDLNLDVTTRISRCRKAIAAWSRDQYLNSRKAIERLKISLDAEISRPDADEPAISSINFDLRQAYRAEKEFWKQRSRQLWLTLEDRNTGYFDASARGRGAINCLSVIETLQAPSYKKMTKLQMSSLPTSVTSSSAGNCTSTVKRALSSKISPAKNEVLIEIPTTGEIRAAMFPIHPDKAPRPDGFSASFF